MPHHARSAGYLQDDSKVTPTLTFNLGIRYMTQTVMQERDGSWSNFDFATGTFVIRTQDGRMPRLAIPRLLAAYPFEGSEKHRLGQRDASRRPQQLVAAIRFRLASVRRQQER